MEHHPVEVIIPAPEKSSRLLALATLLLMVPKAVLAIPHLFVLYFLMMAGVIVAIASQIVVLFGGKYPKEMHEFVVGCLRWQLRVHAYILGLRDEYPPFSVKK